MRPHRTWLYRAEVGAAAISLCMLVATLLVPNWFELLFDAAPDDGDGTLERWVAIGVSCAAFLAFAWLARGERRKPGFGASWQKAP